MNTTEMVQIALDLAQLQELPLDSSVSVPGENITRVLAGIDMGAAELTLARQLGYDCVARHHNMVPRLGKLGEPLGDAISGPAHPRRPAGRADGGGEGGRGL